MLKVKKKTLLAIAGIVWFAAGINIARIGIASYTDFFTFLNCMISLVIFVLFGLMFIKIKQKHTARIRGYEEERKSVFCFFDIRSYLLMAFMMTLGIVLRYGNLAPLRFIAVFYTGLGTALMLVGVLFVVEFARR